jgi:dihydrofolate synthase/folylpolyglutamate synthase
MNILGNTLSEIAFEKAGIIKPRIPAVIGERNTETEKVFIQQAAIQQSPIFFAEDAFSIVASTLNTTSMQVEIKNCPSGRIDTYECGLAGLYQSKNIITVLQSMEVLKESWNITEENIQRGIKEVKALTGLHGRWEIINEHPSVILEVAHNKEGIQQMLQHLELLEYEKLHIIIGVVKDKDVQTVLELLPKDASYYFTQAHIPRALDAVMFQEKASTFSLKGKAWKDVNEALDAALNNASKKDVIVICGSIFLVAEVKRL